MARRPWARPSPTRGAWRTTGTPANGPFDFQLILFDAPVGGAQVGPVVTADDVAVTQGLFTVTLDFGAVFAGNRRWLEIGVRPGASGGAYSTLSPRQELTAGPGSLFSSTTPWTGITNIPPGFADGVDDDTTYTQGAGISISGTVISVATGGITSAMIQDATVSTLDLANNAVTTGKIAPSAVGSSEINDNSVLAADIATFAVGTSELANNAVTRAKLAGTEPGLYETHPACGSTQLVVGVSTCQSILCFPGPRPCSSTVHPCRATSRISQTCNNTLLGYLLDPAIP